MNVICCSYLRENKTQREREFKPNTGLTGLEYTVYELNTGGKLMCKFDDIKMHFLFPPYPLTL